MSQTHKKFYDINRWDNKFFMDLSPVQKLAWEFINDRSDNIGVWEQNHRLLEFSVGAKVDINN